MMLIISFSNIISIIICTTNFFSTFDKVKKMSNPLNKYKLLKSRPALNYARRDYKKLRSTIYSLYNDITILDRAPRNIIQCIRKVREIYEKLFYIYNEKDAESFFLLRDIVHYLCHHFPEHKRQADYIAKKFGFMCSAPNCEIYCDNYLCDEHEKMCMDIRNRFVFMMNLNTSVNITDINYIIFEYYFKF